MLRTEEQRREWASTTDSDLEREGKLERGKGEREEEGRKDGKEEKRKREKYLIENKRENCFTIRCKKN